ncbi:MAG: ABC transporter permease, partial [Gemmatimonadetes bacterium]|nr:ABC transporter permease [Gemmatimonadota bacterium]
MTRGVRTLVAVVLRLAPRTFWDQVGAEYLDVVAERVAHASGRGRWAGLRLGVKEVLGACRAVARLRLGLEQGGIHTRPRTTGGEGMFKTVWQDAAQAAKTLRRNPGFTVAAVVVLALGIGATTAIFSAVNAYFFRPLPFDDPDRLVLLYETNPEFGWIDATAAPANALDWRERVEAFDDIALFRDFGVGDVTIQTDAEPILVGGTTVTGNFFDVLGVQPALGRGFRFEETWLGQDKVVVLGHALWVSHFGADPGVIGTTIPFGGTGEPYEIIGVMPEGFAFPDDRTQLWYTYAWNDPSLAATHFRRAHFVRPVARLRDGVSLEEADAQLQPVVSALQEEYPETNSIMGAGMTPIRDFLIRGVRTPLMVLLGAVTILLLLACSNVANLMLV